MLSLMGHRKGHHKCIIDSLVDYHIAICFKIEKHNMKEEEVIAWPLKLILWHTESHL